MESIEKAFLSELVDDQKTLRGLFTSAGAYDCPCRRKHMTNAQWVVYKNTYLHKVWKLLHERAFKYLDNPSQEAKEKVFKFYNEDVKRIPCYTCRKHYTEYTNDNDLKKACDSRMSLCTFLIDLHNSVNKNTKKSEMSYEEVFKLYGYDFKSKNNVKIYPVMKVVDKKEPVKQQPVKQEQVNNIDRIKYLEQLNKSISKQINLITAGNNNVQAYKNNIIKNSMNSIIKRGGK